MIKLDRCKKAMENIDVHGNPSNRHQIIEEAIALIQTDGSTALQKEYLGIKNYAGFGDQRSDCPYGCGPRHGHIVFSIGRTSNGRAENIDGGKVILDKDEIYLLECVRDFGVVMCGKPNQDDYSRKPTPMNLIDVLKEYYLNEKRQALLKSYLETAKVESYVDLI